MKYFLLFLFSVFLTFQLEAKIMMTPYLQAVTQTSVYVLIECDRQDTVVVMYGTTPAFGGLAKTSDLAITTAKQGTWVHKVLLSGLTPSTKYYYQATQGKTISKQACFTTAAAPGNPFRMVWMADCRTGTDIFAKISRNMMEQNPVLALYGGDLCLNAKYKSWKKEFFIKDQLNFASHVPFFNAAGNHEGWVENTKAFTQSPVSKSGTPDYYSFDYGDLHVLCLNIGVPYGAGSPQYEFAKNDLSQSIQPWKIVMTHAPAYCRGGHGEDAELVKMTTKIFEPNKVDMVFAGHSHFYQHNLVNGIHHLVIGTAGAPLYAPEKAHYTVSQAMEHNFAVVDVSPEKFRVVVYNDDMKVLDTIELSKK
ncbi:MAG: purple acid phosphatase family protein [Bacteroidales bacterium]